jgi:hypothetical protein
MRCSRSGSRLRCEEEGGGGECSGGAQVGLKGRGRSGGRVSAKGGCWEVGEGLGGWGLDSRSRIPFLATISIEGEGHSPRPAEGVGG